jgi:DNA-binding IclR family transcriptional regulator
MGNTSSLATVEPAKTRTADQLRVGSRTLLRGLDLLDAVADGPIGLTALTEKLGLTRSTTHRLATALIERRFLTAYPRHGYKLGPKLLLLGSIAQQQVNLVEIARSALDKLAELTEDTVHLGVLDEKCVLYLEKVPGQRRVQISSRVGDRQPMTSTGLGKALLIDGDPESWRDQFDADQRNSQDFEPWCQTMLRYSRAGIAFDLEENEDQIRCVAAPLRDASGTIVAAISVSSAAQYMSDERMASLSHSVRQTAAEVSGELGWPVSNVSPINGCER